MYVFWSNNIYIFCYFIGKKRLVEYEKMIEDVKSQTGILRVISMNCTTNDIPIGGDIYYKDGGPYEFVYLLSHASYICMDSFHATIFALKFKKEFVHMLKNRDDQEAGSQNTRMYDLFERYGLLYKLYDNHPNEWMKCIDYQRVSNMMDKEARESFEFLKYEIVN